MIDVHGLAKMAGASFGRHTTGHGESEEFWSFPMMGPGWEPRNSLNEFVALVLEEAAKQADQTFEIDCDGSYYNGTQSAKAIRAMKP